MTAIRSLNMLLLISRHAVAISVGLYSALATVVLFVHALFILWIVFGALVASSRPVLRRLHMASLVWGVLIEVLPWSCPLTLLENYLEAKGGIDPYRGGFLLHYLDKLVYPDIPVKVLTIAAVIVCLLNLVFYARRASIQSNLGR